MIRYLSPLFVTDELAGMTEKICSGLENGELLLNTFVITLAETEADIFDIYNGLLFMQPAFRNRDYFVCGLAESEEAAYKLVSLIYSEYFKKHGTHTGLKEELIKRLTN